VKGCVCAGLLVSRACWLIVDTTEMGRANNKFYEKAPEI